MLCSAEPADGRTTELWYSPGGVEDPGGEITDFGNDAQGRITSLRDPFV